MPGGGRTPTGRSPADLSLILGILQGVALRRKKSQQAFYLQTDTRTFEIAAESRKVGNEQPSKQPPKNVPEIVQFVFIDTAD